MNTQKRHIIIIGSGIAGLHMASLLAEAGHDFEILEAKNRVGGRVVSHEGFAEFKIDLGAEFIHGSQSPHFFLAKKHQVSILNRDEIESYIQYQGKLRKYQEVCNMKGNNPLEVWCEEMESYNLENDISFEQLIQDKDYIKDLEHYVEATVGLEWATTNKELSVKGIKDFEKNWK